MTDPRQKRAAEFIEPFRMTPGSKATLVLARPRDGFAAGSRASILDYPKWPHLAGAPERGLDRPTRGRIVVDGVSVGELRRPAVFRRSTVGFVFQLHYLLPALSAQQNVELPMMAAHIPRRERRARARSLLDEVGLGDRRDDLPSELSGGERQRVAIARALANRPPLVLADEPTGSLDTMASRQVWQLLSEIRSRQGTTVIIASHDVTLAEHADRSLHLVDGRLTDERNAPHEQLPRQVA
jgi:ABC-type lipoprotein export system ATPase subunit